VVAFAIAAFLGVLTGSLVGRSRFFSKPTSAVLSSLFAIPLVIIYPIFMAWFGIGASSKIVFGVLSGYFPIAINTLNGVASVEQRYIILCRSIGATRLQTYAKVLIPKALPSIITGLRIGSGLVVIGVIVAEMLASRGGIGFLISHYRSLFETGHVYFGIIISVTFAYAVNRAISAVEYNVSGRRG
jgi:NitT/TauT family transport system permease protein